MTDFLLILRGGDAISNILEIGCNYGYNINYLSKRYNIDCWGIEPSDKAIDYGNSRWKKTNPLVHISQGISDKLPFENNNFDLVMVGFLLYVTPREIITDTIFEIDRVLKQGGILALTDFDTPIPYKRVNRHNQDMPIYKEDYAKRFFSLGYTIAEKVSYTHEKDAFNPNIQERVSTQFLYKENIEELYKNA